MRTKDQFLSEYAHSHRNSINLLIHFICVPVIFFASFALLWLIPIGRWLGLPPTSAYWINGATVVAACASLFYLKLAASSGLAMMGWFVLSAAAIVAIQHAGWPLLWISIGLWVTGWVVQLWGHKIEGAKPSFTDDLVFLLIGPLFVMHELREKLR